MEWGNIFQFLVLCVMLGIATIIKLNLKFLQKHLIPVSMIAGFLGLGVSVLCEYVFDYQLFDRSFLEKLVYHLMGIGFISLALKERKTKKSRAIANTGFAIINTYALQAILGLGISLILFYTILPDLFPASGMILPLAYAQGPGQANNIGATWEKLREVSTVYFQDGGNIGLTIATFGFIWAFLGGIPLLNILTRRRKHRENTFDGSTDEIKSLESDTEVQHTIKLPKTLFVDDFTIQIMLIGLIYLVTFGFLSLAEYLFAPLGSFATTLSDLFWGFNFLFGTVFALLARKILNKLKQKRVIQVNYADNYLLQKISATSFDLMITAGIAAISILAFRQNWIFIMIITTIGAIFTIFYTIFISKRIYKEHVTEHIAVLYGMWTGTITTGIALLREIDPESKTPVPEHAVLGSGFAVIFAIPLMLILNVPIQAILQDKPWMFGLTFVLLIVYSLSMMLGIYLTNRKYDKLEGIERKKK
ncbi:MAG: sodium:glutamate symporter [Clostridiales bacterium]|nr:sodium:glutamate symporter [Clostridiales bacterium]